MKSFSRFMKFIGGRDLFFGLLLLVLIGIVISIYYKISFIFHPVVVIFSTVTPPIILAFIAYYLLNPVISLLERLRINRLWGIFLIVLGLIGLVTGIVLLTGPAISAQVKDLAKNLPEYLKELGDSLELWVKHSFLAPYYDDAYTWIITYFQDLPSKIGHYLGGAVKGLWNVASTITNIAISIFTFPFVLFFLLKDGKKFRHYCLKLLPPSFRKDATEIIHNMDVQVGSYIQGQIIVATCIGILLYTGYLIIGLDYAITLAIIAAVTSVVPYLGPIIAISPAIIIAIVNSPFMLLKLAIVWAIVQFLEGHFISPNIMGRTMHIHPLTIIFVLLCAGSLFGLVGVILGIPGYAILKVIVTYLFRKFKGRYDDYYGNTHGAYESESIDK